MGPRNKIEFPYASLPLTRRRFLQAGALSLGVLACQGLPLPAFGQDVRFGYTRPYPAAHFTAVGQRQRALRSLPPAL